MPVFYCLFFLLAPCIVAKIHRFTVCSFEQAPVCICAYVQSKVCTIAWLQGVSQYFNLCQDALKSIASISLVCLYKKQSYLFEESLGKILRL